MKIKIHYRAKYDASDIGHPIKLQTPDHVEDNCYELSISEALLLSKELYDSAILSCER
jgi:hypothetical protein